jgi:hypothetical protein
VDFGPAVVADEQPLCDTPQVRLCPELSSGSVVEHPLGADLDVPTTIGELGHLLFAVNARFTTPPDVNNDYWLTQLDKPTVR